MWIDKKGALMNDRNVQAYDSQELEDREGSGLILSKDPTTADHK